MPDTLTPRPARRRTPEADEQAALIRWRDLFAPQEPRLKWLHSSLNGVKMTKAQASKAKAAGMTAGVWDLFLPIPRFANVCDGGEDVWQWCGLYIEMKAPGGRLSREQREFSGEGLDYAYRFVVCRTWIEAATAICDYLGLPADHPAREAAK